MAARLKRNSAAKKTPTRKSQAPRPRAGLRMLARVAGHLALFAGVGLVLVGGYGWLAERPAFRVAEAQVLGTRQLSRLEVLSELGVGADASLLRLKVGALAAKLEQGKWITEAKVERILPATLRVTVTERVPGFLALVEGRLYHLDREMASFAALDLGAKAPDAPVLTGLGRADLMNPDLEVQRLLDLARQLYRSLDAAETGPGGRLSEVHLDRSTGLSCVWDGLGAVVRLGFDDFPAKLARLGLVLGDLDQRGELGRAVLIDLDVDRRAVVRLAEGLS